MNRKTRVNNLKKIAQEEALIKKAQQATAGVNTAGNAEAEFNKVLDELLNNIDIPSLDNL